MNLQKNYKRLFKGRASSNDSKLTRTRLMETDLNEAAAPLKQAKEISGLTDINPSQKYFVVFEPYGYEAIETYMGSGASVIEFLKDAYSGPEWADEYQHDNGKMPTDDEFLQHVENVNGDGHDYTQVFEM